MQESALVGEKRILEEKTSLTHLILTLLVLGATLKGLHATWTSARVSTEPSTSTPGPLLQRGVTTFVSCF